MASCSVATVASAAVIEHFLREFGLLVSLVSLQAILAGVATSTAMRRAIVSLEV
jgi:hypothetical protein